METECSLSYSEKPVIGPSPGPDEFNPHSHTQLQSKDKISLMGYSLYSYSFRGILPPPPLYF